MEKLEENLQDVICPNCKYTNNINNFKSIRIFREYKLESNSNMIAELECPKCNKKFEYIL